MIGAFFQCSSIGAYKWEKVKVLNQTNSIAYELISQQVIEELCLNEDYSDELLRGIDQGVIPSWSGEGLIYVNQDGNRFVNEVGMRDERAEGILAQGGVAYAIYNQEVADRLNLE